MVVQIGIDLGTTNTVCAWIENGKEKYVRFGEDDILPSVLMQLNGSTMIGKLAKRRSVNNPDNFIRSSKTFMGDDTWSRTIEDRTFTAKDVATEILLYVKNSLLSTLKLPEDTEVEAVITVPAYFKAKQREDTKEAGQAAGLTVKTIIQEPVAAAMAATTSINAGERIFVLDLGGGTFDVSILKYGANNELEEVETVEGDQQLGGDDFDNEVYEWLCSQVLMETGINLADDNCGIDKLQIAREKLRKLAEELKIRVSSDDEATMKIANLFMHNGNKAFHLEVTFSREIFEDICQRLFKKIERTVKRALSDIDLSPSDIDRVLLVGGSAQIPKIQEMVRTIFKQEPFKNFDLSRVVAQGAALYATKKSGLVEMILPHSIGIEVIRDGEEGKMEIMLPRRAKYPLEQEKIFTTSQDYQEEITISVYEGEEDDVENNDFYGSLNLPGIAQGKAGEAQISIKILFDENGILHVKAKDLKSGASLTEQLRLKKSSVKQQTAKVPTNVVLMMDTSGSMNYQDKMPKAKKAAMTLINEQLDLSQGEVAIVGFDDYMTVAQTFTQNKTRLSCAIDSLRTKGGTQLATAFSQLPSLFNKAKNKHYSKCAIIVTDGRTSNEAETIRLADELREQNIRLIAIGVGEDVHITYLMNISSSESDYFSISTMDELTEVFSKVSHSLRLAEEGTLHGV